MNNKPLEGIKVVDFGQHGAGSACGKVLADWGADVVKIEAFSGCGSRKAGGQLGLSTADKDNIHHEIVNGNKRSVAINLKDPAGLAIADKMIAGANIFFSNYRLRALKIFGFDYETLSAKYPHIIWGHLSGFGNKGPQADDAGFDVVAYWAKTGLLMDLTEKGSAPNTAPFGIGDLNVGYSLAAAMSACLYKQLKTGRGEKVENSLYGHAVWTVASQVQSTTKGDKYPKSRKTDAVSPFINSYKCADDTWLFTAVMDYPGQFPRLANMIGKPELADNPKFINISEAKKNEEELVSYFDEWYGQHSWSEVDAVLKSLDIAHSRINHFADVAHDPQAVVNGYVYPFTTRGGETEIMISSPVKFGEGGPFEHKNAPLVGEQTTEVLKELGYSDEEIAKLFEDKVVAENHFKG